MCGAQTAGGEGGRIRLAHDELLARQVQDLLAVLVRHGEKRIVLLRRDARERLEPVGVVRGALLNGPFHHGLGHDIRRGHGDLTAVLDHAHDLRIDLLRQTLLHDGSAEYIFPKIFGYLHWNSSLSDSCRSLSPLTNYRLSVTKSGRNCKCFCSGGHDFRGVPKRGSYLPSRFGHFPMNFIIFSNGFFNINFFACRSGGIFLHKLHSALHTTGRSVKPC